MHEILRHLRDGARVLDLGSRSGSFDPGPYPFLTVRLDRECPGGSGSRNFVQADAARLPFPPTSFDAVISNHSLEHFEDLDGALKEVATVLKPGGTFFAAVPDSTTLTDRLYRLLARGGGHVNAFSSFRELVRRIEQGTGLRLSAARPLCSSLSFLNRRNHPSRPPRLLLLLGGGWEPPLRLLNYLFRLSDWLFGTRASLYGWALYFGPAGEPVSETVWSNVCVRCGAGHPAAGLLASGHVRRGHLFTRHYHCPHCGARNFFTPDEHFLLLK